jgi:hypothetical protein
MTTIYDMVEDWIQIRSTLQRQIQMLESGQIQAGAKDAESAITGTILRLKGWVHELNELLKEHSRV